MPFIKVQTSVSVTADRRLEILQALSTQLAAQTGKPETYVMTTIEPDVAMTFGGTSEPTCYVEIKSIGTMTAAQTKAMSECFCQQIEQSLGIPQARIYIEFSDIRGAMWGWNGSTFG
jgi:phenylpyruvate tautomerase